MSQTGRVPLSEAVDKSVEQKSEAPAESVLSQDALSYLDDIEYHRTADFFGLSMEDRRDSKIADKLSFLDEWAGNETKSKDRVDKLLKIKSLIKGLGWSMQGKDLIKRLYVWVRLDNDRKRIEKQQELIHG